MVTKEQQIELAAMARRANRRLERASEGQKAALEYYLKDYTTRKRSNGDRIFQQGKARTEAEFNKRMAELESFLSGETSTRRGWENLKSKNVKAAGETIRGMDFSITDAELKNVLQELPKAASRAEYYKALENVEIAKREKGSAWTASKEEIRQAIESRRTDQQRTETLLRLRGK